MEYHILVNEKILKMYKQTILTFNVRLFTNEYFYEIDKYEVPTDLSGIKDYLPYIENIIIDALPSFIDYVNVLLVLDYLNTNKYNGKVNINYFNIFSMDYNKAIISKVEIKDYKNVGIMINELVNKTSLENLVLLPGSINFINFYNNLINKDIFMALIEDEIEDMDNDEIVEYLYNKYSTIGLSKEFYKNYIGE